MDGAKRVTMKTLKEVGRYALGIEWADQHESILPYRALREHCPCETCGGNVTELPASAHQLADLQKIGSATLFFRWADGHETLFMADELRGLCRCAYCAGEPKYPITG